MTMRPTTRNNFRERANLVHFRFLGLQRGECRTDVIRSAADALSGHLSVHEHHYQAEIVAKRRYEIALAAYRLLDPRGRSSIYERVQLAYPIDREEQESPTVAPDLLVSKMDSVHPLPKSERVRRIKLMQQPVIRKAIENGAAQNGEVIGTNSLPSDAMIKPESTDSWIDERRGVVRMLRHSDEATIRGLSPLGWLRSKLGI